MRKNLFPLAFVAMLALPLAACDSGDGEDNDFIGRPSESEIADLVEALEGVDGIDCDVEIEAIGEGDVSGELSGSDCELDDGTSADFYAFEVLQSTDVQIDMESDDFADVDPFLALLDADGEGIAQNDDVDLEGEDFDARIMEDLDEGLYIVIANTAGGEEAGAGNYQLTIDAEGSDD